MMIDPKNTSQSQIESHQLNAMPTGLNFQVPGINPNEISNYQTYECIKKIENRMKYWLLNQNHVWSIYQQERLGIKVCLGMEWNFQAAKNLKAMSIGDLCFFYHSNIGKEIVGIVEVTKSAFRQIRQRKICSRSVRFKNIWNVQFRLKRLKKQRLFLICRSLNRADYRLCLSILKAGKLFVDG